MYNSLLNFNYRTDTVEQGSLRRYVRDSEVLTYASMLRLPRPPCLASCPLRCVGG